jgi:rhamnosyltransferase subunit B
MSAYRPAPMQVYLVTFGSRGDVHPLLGLGQALRARGHTATVLTNPAFAGEVAQAGLGFVPVGAESDYRDTLAHPKLWHPVDGLGVMWRYLLRPALRPTVDTLRALCSGGGPAPLVLASPLAMGARLAQEALGLRLVSTYTSPTLLRSLRDPLTIAQWRVPSAVPAWARRAIWRLLDAAKLDPLVKPALESLRRELGLPPLGRQPVFDRWLHAPAGGLALFTDWFASPQADWPVPVQPGTFPLYDEPAGAPQQMAASLSLQRFLDAGPAPVVFMPGSAQQGTAAFFQAAMAVCAQLGVRGVLLGPAAASELPESTPAMWAAPYVPFAQLLPRARAIVHHGGIGTCAQALRAGLPQLVWPQAYDQFDNAMRIEQLGAGLRLNSQPLQATELARQLGHLLAGPDTATDCQRHARLLAGSSLAPACAWLETLP